MHVYKMLTIKVTVIFAVLFMSGVPPLEAGSDTDKGIESFLNQLYKGRADLISQTNKENIEIYYLLDHSASRYAMRQELHRNQYIHAWGERRGINFVDAVSDIRITRIKSDGNTAQVSLVQSLKLSYVYLNKILPPQSFGIGTRHVLTLKKMKGDWYLYKEWYLDPLDENSQLIPDTATKLAPSANYKKDFPVGNQYNRDRAVAFANKYAGIAWGAGNNHRYNPKYMDYTSKGGDCTNFASQVIGDQDEGGGLHMSGGWRYFYPVGGSKLWVQTDGFKNYLIRSGYGKVIIQGLFTEVVNPTEKFPNGAISELLPGDLIAYVMHGDVDHFSIVTGFDENGYPLVNSHTADRYRVPFDLGWDKHTGYLLIHMND